MIRKSNPASCCRLGQLPQTRLSDWLTVGAIAVAMYFLTRDFLKGNWR